MKASRGSGRRTRTSRPAKPRSEGSSVDATRLSISAASTPTLRKRPSKPADTRSNNSLDTEDEQEEDVRETGQRRTTSKHHSIVSGATPRSAHPDQVSKATSEGVYDKGGNHRSKLGRILESQESKLDLRSENHSRAHVALETGSSHRTSDTRHSNIVPRRAEHLLNLTNPSLLSVVSRITNTSGTSSGSNSTITQASYDKERVSKRRRSRSSRKKASLDSVPSSSFSRSRRHRSSGYSEVFQYMDRDQESQVSYRPHSSYGNDGSSEVGSNSSLSEFGIMANIRTAQALHEQVRGDLWADDGGLKHQDTFNSDSGISVRGSSPDVADATSSVPQFVHASVHDGDENEDDDEDDAEEEGGGIDENEEDEEDSESDDDDIKQMALQRIHTGANLPRPDSSSERLRDRLRDQEQELRQHVLQSPQPQRGFHSFMGMPPPSPAMHMSSANAPCAPLPPQYDTPTTGPRATIDYRSMLPPSYVQQVGPPSISAPHDEHDGVLDAIKPEVGGYEMIARKLEESTSREHKRSEDSFPPMYRKFERLNHRLLLHLQDELAELEDELRALDKNITRATPEISPGRLQPASRRRESRYGHELHFRRTEVLGLIYVKLGQYSMCAENRVDHALNLAPDQALSSFNNMRNSFERPRPEDVRGYRDWLSDRAPISEGETHFLKEDADLMSFRPKQETPHQDQTAHEPQRLPVTMVGLLCGALLPILAFASYSNFLLRIFILVLNCSMVGVVVIATNRVDIMAPTDWLTCASM